MHPKELKAAMGVKIAANQLEGAVAGTQLYAVRAGDDVEALKAEVMSDMSDIFSSVDKSGEGVCVQVGVPAGKGEGGGGGHCIQCTIKCTACLRSAPSQRGG